MHVPKVVVLGDACVDMVIRLPDRASQGTPALSNSSPQLHGGGSGANVAVALARLGTDVAMVGAVGDDGYGRWVHDDLIRESVDVDGLVLVADAFTPMVMALVEPNGERLIVVWPPESGAHLKLQTDAIDPVWITSASWVHSTGMCLRESPAREAVLTAMALARDAGVTVSLDLNLRLESWGLDDTDREVIEQAMALSDVVLGNAQEEILPMAGAYSVKVASQMLCGGTRTIVARQGSEGAWVTTPNEAFSVPAFPTRVVDTLGAGDAFNGGFIAACLANADTREAARWGNAVAALKIGRAGARGLPSLEELKRVLTDDTRDSS